MEIIFLFIYFAQKKMKVFKFGGASVKDASSIKQVAHILSQNSKEHLVVVVSAMGKTTNALEEVYRAYISNSQSVLYTLLPIKEYHFNVLKDLFNENDTIFLEVEDFFIKLSEILSEPPDTDIYKNYDKIVSFGELISTKIISHYLRTIGISVLWVDIRNYLITDSNHKDANILFDISAEKLKQVFSKKGIYVCQGFIGSSIDGHPSTLGREGSDYSAAAIANMLEAESLTVWKDVPGILNADPRIFSETIKLDVITYKEAIELAYYGAQVIHPKTIKPLQNKNIPLYVKPFEQPQSEGTVIKDIEQKLILPPIYIFKFNQVLFSISTKDFSFIAEDNLSYIFAELARCKIKVNMMQQTAITFSICFDFDEHKLHELVYSMSSKYQYVYNTQLTLVTIRHYTDEAVEKVISGKKIYLKELSRKTAKIVLK